MHKSFRAANETSFNRALFGEDFKWGVSAAAYQTEGAYLTDGKGLSNWDVFTNSTHKVKNNENGNVATDFYYRYEEDITIIASLGIPNFRFSISWSRIFPDGIGRINQKGIDFYNRVIDCCLKNNVQPWITIYHWDLPEALEQKGGWTNRDIVHWFSDYVAVCVREFKDRVKHWMVLNEPVAFTGAGYFLGIHAPGKKGAKNFLPAVHHAALALAAGARIIKQEHPKAEVGSTFSCSFITPHTTSEKDAIAVTRVDALLNRLCIEPALGLGYPVKELPFLHKMEKYILPGDDKLMTAPLDFAGIQNYTREVASCLFFIPYLKARLVPADKRKVYHTAMNWEVYPEAIYEMIKKFNGYTQLKKIIITENGAAFNDVVEANAVHDMERINYLQKYMEQVLRAKKEGLKIDGYFVWSLTDNFEWAEGYRPRFGLVSVDFKTQQRIIKDSGYWYRDFLK